MIGHLVDFTINPVVIHTGWKNPSLLDIIHMQLVRNSVSIYIYTCPSITVVTWWYFQDPSDEIRSLPFQLENHAPRRPWGGVQLSVNRCFSLVNTLRWMWKSEFTMCRGVPPGWGDSQDFRGDMKQGINENMEFAAKLWKVLVRQQETTHNYHRCPFPIRWLINRGVYNKPLIITGKWWCRWYIP